MNFSENLAVYILIVPLLSTACSVIFRANQSLRSLLEVLLAFASFVLCLRLCSIVLSVGNVTSLQIDFVAAAPILLEIDIFGALFACMAAGLWTLTSVYALGYLRGTKDQHEARFMSFLALSLAATFLVAFSGNMLTLYMGYELLSLSTYPLVTHSRTEAAKHAGRKYLFYILGSSIALALPAMLIFYTQTGTLDFVEGGNLSPQSEPWLIITCFFLFLFGFAKAAVLPLHSWLPGAMVAPTPVSALLHAVAVVKVGVFSIIRSVLYLIGPSAIYRVSIDGFPLRDIGIAIAVVTLLFSACVALSQDDLKRRLAFSTISQLAYIVLGTVLLAPKAALGAMIHIGVHAVSKITLFFCAGSIYVASKQKSISGMNGIAKKMPLTVAAFTVASLSIVGFPLTAGFWSKWNLLQGAVESRYILIALVYLVGSLLAVFYLFPVVITAYSDELNPKLKDVSEADWKIVVPLLVTASLTVVLFFASGPLISMLEGVVELMFSERLIAL